MIVPQDGLQAWKADTFFDAINREGMPKNVRRARPGDLGAVGNALDEDFSATDPDADGFLLCEPTLEKNLRPWSHWNNPTLLSKLAVLV